MSREDVELVRRSYEAFASGDIDAALGFFDEDGVFVSRFGGMEGRRYRGAAGIRQYAADIDEAWSSFERELEELVEVGEAVLAVLRIKGVSKLTGIPLEERTGLAYWVRDGKIVRMVSYPSVDAAREALGVSG